MNNTLYLVIPCYNEQEVLPETARVLNLKFDNLLKSGRINMLSKIVFVNDGSKDSTWETIQMLHKKNHRFIGINLSRNNGHQNALMAGMLYAKNRADVVITMDSDLQDDINAIDEMLDKYLDGCDIVYGVRNNRKSDSFLKRTTANLFYKVMRFLGTDTINNHADFRLMSCRVIEALEQYEEVNLFLRGIIPLIGFKAEIVYYTRNSRFAGKTKYSPGKMIGFAWEGITSFSMKPMRLISLLGLFIFTFSIMMLIYILIRYFTGHTTVGWASILVSIWTIGGLLLLSMGIIGEYIGKIYLETKKRPRYFIDSILDDSAKDNDKTVRYINKDNHEYRKEKKNVSLVSK